MEEILSIIIIIPIALFATVLHELSHGLISYAFGDPTPKETGRLTLNPIKHLDLFGILSLIFFHVGWAKPVMIDPRYYKKPKLAVTIVSLAGPLTNFVLALLSGLVFVLLYPVFNRLGEDSLLANILIMFFYYGVVINVGFGLFNLIPLPPLDGSKILGILIPDRAYARYMSYQRYGMFFILGLLILMEVLEYFGLPNLITYLMEYVSDSIVTMWETIIY